MKLTSFRLFVLLSIACGLLVAAAFGLTYGANKLFARQGQTLEDAKINYDIAQNREQALQSAEANIKKYEQLNIIAQGILPQEKDQALTVREIVAIAAQHNVPLSSVTFPDSKLGVSTKSKTNAATESQLTAVKGISGLYVMEIKVASSGVTRYDNFLRFISALQSNRRTANITSVNATPSEANRNFVSFNLNINAYIRP
jgi:hypothetical protein